MPCCWTWVWQLFPYVALFPFIFHLRVRLERHHSLQKTHDLWTWVSFKSKSNPTNTIQRIFQTQTHLAMKCNKGQSKLNTSQSLRHIQKLGRTIPRAASHFCSSCLRLQHSWLNLYVTVFSEKRKKKSIFSAFKWFFGEEIRLIEVKEVSTKIQNCNNYREKDISTSFKWNILLLFSKLASPFF